MNQADHFDLVDNLLYKLPNVSSIHDSRKSNLRIVIPESLANTVIANKHNNLDGSGHCSFVRILYNIKRKYYIHNLANLLKEYMNTCGTCLRFRQSKIKPTLPLKITAAKSCTQPFEILQVDHCGPFKSSKYKYEHILVVVDESSQYTWLMPTKTTDAIDAANAINSVMKVHGNCKAITSDRGPAFTSKLMSALAKLKGIKWRHNSSHMPSSSGLVEQKVSTVKNFIKHAKLKNPSIDIFDTIADVQFSMNNSHNTAIGTSAYFAFLGRHPTDVFEHNLQLDPLPSSSHVFVENLMKESEQRHSLIKEAKNTSSQNMKQKHDSKIISLPDIKLGDLCMIDTPNHPLDIPGMKKFKMQKRGPYMVTHLLDDYNCTLSDLNGTLLNDMFPIRKLTKIPGYIDTFPPDLQGSKVINAVYDDSDLSLDFDNLFNENNKVDSNTVNMTVEISDKCKMGRVNGEKTLMKLVYPLGHRQAGTWLPVNMVN